MSTYPKYTLEADYNYNSLIKLLTLNNFYLEGPRVNRFTRSRVMKKFPNDLKLQIKEWSLDNIHGSSCQIKITAYLFDDPDDAHTEPGVYANYATEIMTGSVFSETTVNLWQPPDFFTLLKDAEQELDQEFTIAFRPKMNIKMDHGNFTNNYPVVSWNTYPGAIDHVTIEFCTLFLAQPPIKLSEKVDLNNKQGKPLPELDTESFYASRPDQETTDIRDVYSVFTANNGYKLSERVYLHEKLLADSVNDIKLYYYFNQEPFQMYVSAEIDPHDRLASIGSPEGPINLIPDYEHIKKSKENDNPNNIFEGNINYVIMAEGFRADQMSFFLDYAKKAVNAEIFGFSKDDWDKKVNVVVYKTISPQSFNLPTVIHKELTFFNYKPGDNYRNIAKERMKTVVANTSEKSGLKSDNVDAYIIFVNTGPTYSATDNDSYLGSIVEYYISKPAPYIIINAQFIENMNDGDFSRYVHIHRIKDILSEIEDE